MFFNRRIFLFLFTLLFSAHLFGQKKTINVDSIYSIVMSQPDSSNKVEELLKLFKKTKRNTRPDILEKALEISEKIYYIDGIAKSYDRKGYIERKSSNFLKAIEYHKRALSFFEKSEDTLSKIKCFNNLAVALRKINFEKEAYNYYLQALALAKQKKINRSIAISYNGIGNVFIDTEDYDRAVFFLKKALEVEKADNNLKGVEYGLANIGEVYILKKEYDSAKVYLDDAFTLGKKIFKPEKLGVENNLYGLLYKEKKEYNKSIEYYKTAINLLKKRNIKRYLANSFINMGLVELELDKRIDAYNHINKGLTIALDINSKENISFGYKALVAYFSKINDYKKALNAYQVATKFHDSIVGITVQKSIISTQMIYETKQKDEQIKRLALEKELESEKSKKNFTRMIIISIVSLFSIVFLFMFFNLKRRNNDLELSYKNSEIQKYLSQIKILEDKMDKEGKPKINMSKKLKDLDLTKRETDVLKLVAQGFSNDEIAEQMFISKNTVKSHVKNIYLKLDVKNRIQAIKKVQQS